MGENHQHVLPILLIPLARTRITSRFNQMPIVSTRAGMEHRNELYLCDKPWLVLCIEEVTNAITVQVQ